MFSKFRALFPTIIFILVCVLVSMVVLNFFQVDMNDNDGFKVLNRMLTVEGMENEKKNSGTTGIIKEGLCGGKHKKEGFFGMCSSGKHVEGMCGGMGCEGMENKEEEEEKNELGALASSLMD